MRPSEASAGRAAPRHARARRLQARRGLLPGPLRRHACALHREPRRAGAGLAARRRQGLGHGRIRHAAARHARAHAARGDAGQAGRPHAGDPAPDRPLAARRRRPEGARRAPDHHRLRRAPGRRRHAHRRDHRRLGGAPRRARLDARARDDRRRACSRDHVAAISCGIVAARRCSTSTMSRIPQAGTDANFVMTGAGGIVEIQGTAEGAPFSEADFLALLALARSGIAQARRPAEARGRSDDAPCVRSRRRPLVVASHNRGQGARDRRAARALRLRRQIGRASSACPSRRRPARPSRRTPILKARAAAEASGLPALADDSGLAVDALGGEPGIYSARWAGAGRRISPSPCGGSRSSCRRAGATTPEQRRAHFVCGAVPSPRPDGEVETFAGRVDGTLVWPPRGDKGFGYDPIFLPDGHDRTFGEMSAEEKHGWRPGAGAVAPRPRLRLFARRLPRRRRDERARCADPAQSATAFGVYVHWPFCAAKCPYCDFNCHVRHAAARRGALRRSLRARARALRRADAGPHRHQHLPRRRHAVADGAARRSARSSMRSRELWPVAPDAEITLEANPDSVEAERFRGYRAAGVNRVSLGVQSLDDAALKALGRLHDAAEARRAVELARDDLPAPLLRPDLCAPGPDARGLARRSSKRRSRWPPTTSRSTSSPSRRGRPSRACTRPASSTMPDDGRSPPTSTS